MYFLIELAKIVKNIPDKHFSGFANHRYIFFKQYPGFEKHWDEYCKKNNIFANRQKASKWRNMFREIKQWNEQELDYMYMQIMSLARNFLGNRYSYFEIKTYSGSTTIPDKAVM